MNTQTPPITITAPMTMPNTLVWDRLLPPPPVVVALVA
jgi:hypothetical protein